MKRIKIKKYLLLGLFLIKFNLSYALPDGFTYLKDINSSILNGLRYPTEINFTGNKVKGYKNSIIIMTTKAAEALKCAQNKFNKDNYNIVVYDAYRPQDAVDYFIQWSKDKNEQNMKSWFYPHVNKNKVFDLGYVAEKSGHTRGSTVDITLIKKSKNVIPIKPMLRKLKNEVTIMYLEDGTLDMGSSFDLFDKISHFRNNLIGNEYLEKRIYLKNIMETCGFSNYENEWWHFTLKNEPFPDTYFNFPVE